MEKIDKDKHKGGRPKKSESQRKKRIISIRFSDKEYYAIKHRAELVGLSVGAYSQSAILNSKIVEPMKKEDAELLRKLSGEANNLNQLTHEAHKFGLNYLKKQAENLLENLSEIINKLSDDWKNHKRKKF